MAFSWSKLYKSDKIEENVKNLVERVKKNQLSLESSSSDTFHEYSKFMEPQKVGLYVTGVLHSSQFNLGGLTTMFNSVMVSNTCQRSKVLVL